MEYETQLPQPAHVPSPAFKRRLWRWLGFGLLGLGIILGSYFVLRHTAQNGSAQTLGDIKTSPNLFVGWNNPDLAVVVSGETYGYLQPCGCSIPQKGGLTRRYNFMQSLRDKGWPVTAVDLGDIAPASGPQRFLKYETAMQALKIMDYRAVGIGKIEFLMPLTEALARYSLNNPLPRPVAANLAKTSKGELFDDLNVRKGEIYTINKVTVGVTGAVDENSARSVRAGLPPKEIDTQFLPHTDILPRFLAVLGMQKPALDLSVLLFQGSEKEAKTCAAFLQQERQKNSGVAPVHVILCLADDEEPPGVPVKVGGTSIISIGHKGRYVGVVGVWKTPNGPQLKYQLVAIGPEYATPAGKEVGHPVMQLLEKYAQQVRDENYLARFPRDNHEVQANLPKARYVGTETCANCHVDAYNVWKASKHAHAFQALVDATNPKLRQFDGECIVCHTVGFKYHTGYNDPPRGANDKQKENHNLKLRDVGCESCHGPGSEHVNDFNSANLHQLINPYRPKAQELNPATPAAEKDRLNRNRMQNIDNMCMKCHDSENDVHWGSVSFQQKWAPIAHPTLKKVDAAQANGAGK